MLIDLAIAAVLAAVVVQLASGLAIVAVMALVVLGVLGLTAAAGQIRRRRRGSSRAARPRPRGRRHLR